MEELMYSAIDLAAIISSMQLDCQEQAHFLENVWDREWAFIAREYRQNKRRMLLDTFYWLMYFSDKPSIDFEFPLIQKDALAIGSDLDESNYSGEFSNLDIFFKSVRLRILYGGGSGYVRIKRRTLLRKYGYKRMSRQLADYFRRCLLFYHLQSYVRDGVQLQIEDISMDEMIIFRIM